MKKALIVLAVFGVFTPISVMAHERFVSDVSFERWERHCHTYESTNAQECWAIYQKRVQRNENNALGFVIIVHENQHPLSLELRNINHFGHSLDVQVDDNESIRIACHGAICTPFERDDAKNLIEQMVQGKMLRLQSNLFGDSLGPNGETERVEAVPLTGFSTALN